MNLFKNNNAKLTIALVVCVTCVLVALIATSYAWYQHTPGASKSLTVEMDGVIFIEIAVTDVDDMEGRVLRPARALPSAVANGMPMDVLHTYEETKMQDNPSYIEVVASCAEFDGEVDFRLPTNTQGTFAFEIGLTPSQSIENTFGKEQFVVDEISFYCHDADGVVDPLQDIEEDKCSGTLRVTGQTNVFFHVKLHLALADELMDERLMELDTIYCMMAFYMQGEPIEIQPPDEG